MGMAAEPQFHVLAVDDSIIDRKLIERLLKTSSYQVTTVDSGSKALEFLGWQEDQPSISPDNQQEVEVNLIITDYCMPGMTGYDLLKKVKESSSLRSIPVVIMSSENVPSRISRCLEEGAEEFFLKPVRLSDVNRLRPHMLRAKYGQQQQQNMLEECKTPYLKSEQLQQQQQQHQQNMLEECKKPDLKSEQLQQQQQQQHQQYMLEECKNPDLKLEQLQQQPPQQLQKPDLKLEQLQQQQPQQLQPQQLQECVLQTEEQPQQQQLQLQQQNNNKRKPMEEGLSSDRTRPRYNGLTTVV